MTHLSERFKSQLLFETLGFDLIKEGDQDYVTDPEGTPITGEPVEGWPNLYNWSNLIYIWEVIERLFLLPDPERPWECMYDARDPIHYIAPFHLHVMIGKNRMDLPAELMDTALYWLASDGFVPNLPHGGVVKQELSRSDLNPSPNSYFEEE